MNNTPTPKEGSLDRMVERVLPNYKKCEANLSSQAEWFDLPITDPPVERLSDDTRSTEPLPNEEELQNIIDTLWAAALDAQVMIREEGASESAYLKKRDYHMKKAMHLFREYAKGYALEAETTLLKHLKQTADQPFGNVKQQIYTELDEREQRSKLEEE